MSCRNLDPVRRERYGYTGEGRQHSGGPRGRHDGPCSRQTADTGREQCGLQPRFCASHTMTRTTTIRPLPTKVRSSSTIALAVSLLMGAFSPVTGAAAGRPSSRPPSETLPRWTPDVPDTAVSTTLSPTRRPAAGRGNSAFAETDPRPAPSGLPGRPDSLQWQPRQLTEPLLVPPQSGITR